MFDWLAANIGTIAAGGVLLILVSFAIRKMMQDRKNGKSSCGGDCGSCGGCSLHR